MATTEITEPKAAETASGEAKLSLPNADKKAKEKKPKEKKSASVGRLMALAKPELHILSVATVCLLLSSAASVAMPAFIGFIIAAITSSGSNPKRDLEIATVTLVSIFTAGGLFSFLRGWLYTLAGERVVARLRRNLFDHLISMPISFFDNNKTGELMNRLSSDTTVVQNAATVNISMALRFGVQVIASLVMIFFYSWKLCVTRGTQRHLDSNQPRVLPC